MDLKQLRAIGAFKDRTLVKRTVTVRHHPLLPPEQWEKPDQPLYGAEKVEHVFNVHVRKRSSADTIEIARADPRLVAHVMVLRCIVDDAGQQVFSTLDEVLLLEEWMFLPLANVANEVNEAGPKASPPTMKRGANSRSRSGAGASGSGKKRSARKSGASGSPTAGSTAP